MSLRKARRRIHLIGIGGMGMSALAEILACTGFKVSGSDRSRSMVTQRLETLGIPIQYSHAPELVCDADLVVYSSAVTPENSERRYAADNAIHTMRRAEMMGELMRSKFTIAISGTHGKTTTTAMMGHVFRATHRDPTIMAGGIIRELGSNAVVGAGNILIAEADEFDRSFLCMSPSLAIVTNIDVDHLDCYDSIETIRDAFVEFCGLVPFYGGIIACVDDENVRRVLPRLNKTVITYSAQGREADYRAGSIDSSARGTRFTVEVAGKPAGEVTIALHGVHNVANALAVIAAGMELEIPFDEIAEACSSFHGVQRRFEIKGTRGGVTVVDDYAHHPSEISVTIDAARRAGYGRVIAVFQPHLYTRTRDLASEFAEALSGADRAIVTEIYRAREEPIPGVDARLICRKAQESKLGNIELVAEKEQLARSLPQEVSAGDVIILMGAGDISSIADSLLQEIADG